MIAANLQIFFRFGVKKSYNLIGGIETFQMNIEGFYYIT